MLVTNHNVFVDFLILSVCTALSRSIIQERGDHIQTSTQTNRPYRDVVLHHKLYMMDDWKSLILGYAPYLFHQAGRQTLLAVTVKRALGCLRRACLYYFSFSDGGSADEAAADLFNYAQLCENVSEFLFFYLLCFCLAF